MQSNEIKYVFYFDWYLGPRFGGPPGYLWNLKEGFTKIKSKDKAVFIYKSVITPSTNQGELFTFGVKGGEKDTEVLNSSTESTLRKAEFYSRYDWLYIPPEDILNIVSSNCKIISCHTTANLIKVHNSLVKHGLRHRVLLALTSHCPELPARELASHAFNDGASSNSAQCLYNYHNEMDLHAFRVSDIVIFPCEEAMEPYYQTIPNFKKLFGQKDIRFVPTGAQRPLVNQDNNAVRSKLNISENQFVVSYIGRHNHVKGYDILKKVGQGLLENNEDITFLIGGKEGPVTPLYHPRWIEYGWTDFPGNILSASDVFVLPNKQTYFDLMLIEVLSLGIIVVASNTGGNSYFKNKSKGIFLYDSEEELEEILLNLKSKTKTDLAKFGQENLNLYESNHTIEKFAENYHELLSNIYKDYFDETGIAESISDNPKVSIIIPVYNVEKYLDDCLHSVKVQTLEDIEVIIVDDGSTDGSSEIIESYVESDPRFKLVSQVNGGLSDARNSGLKLARGSYIAFLDSDDAYDDTFVEKLYKACIKNNTKLAVCGVESIKDSGEHLSYASSFLSDELVVSKWKDGKIKITEETVTSIYPSAWNKLYHNSLFKGIKYNKGLYYEDHPVFYKIFSQEEYFTYVPEFLYLQRERTTNRITQDGSLKSLDVICVADYIYSLFLERWNADIAREQYLKVLIRLVWERKWVVNSAHVMSLLAKLTLMKLEMIQATDAEILRFQDGIIEKDFIEELRSKANRFGDWKNTRINHFDPHDCIYFSDRTVWKEKQENNFVELNKEDNFILVHPYEDVITTAELFGLGFFGTGKLTFTVCLEHVKAESCDFRVVVSDYLLTSKEIKNIDNSFNVIYKSKWKTLSAFLQQNFEIELSNITPTMTIYFQSRLDNTRGNYSWLRVRSLSVQKSSQ